MNHWAVTSIDDVAAFDVLAINVLTVKNISLVDLRKVFNLMDRSMLFEIKEKYWIPNLLIVAVKKLYDRLKAVVSFVLGVEVDGGEWSW